MKLKLQEGSHGIVVKNLYLSSDRYMRIRMARVEGPNVFTSYTPGSVSTLSLCFLGFTSSMLGTTVGIWIIIFVVKLNE